jgi:hypothetical protein
MESSLVLVNFDEVLSSDNAGAVTVGVIVVISNQLN